MDSFGAQSTWLLDVAPIVLSHFIFTPLDGIALWPLSIFPSHEIESALVYVPGQSLRRPTSLVTYMLLHQNTHHLLSNVCELVLLSIPVHNIVGGYGLHGIFWIGGCFAAADPLGLKEIQLQNSISSWFGVAGISIADIVSQWTNTIWDALGPVLGASTTGGRLHSAPLYPWTQWWDSGVKTVARYTAPLMLQSSGYIGSSGGVAALIGAGVVAVVYDFSRKHSSRDAYSQQSDLLRLMKIAPTVMGSVKFLVDELDMFSTNPSTGIDHAGHSSGFFFGKFCGLKATSLRRDTCHATQIIHDSFIPSKGHHFLRTLLRHRCFDLNPILMYE
eukprot:m.1103067 g.1103067  ORF g.1103067 m.1103067 type:complete len:331 (-) comp24329_c0_seq6:7946-8938(-)